MVKTMNEKFEDFAEWYKMNAALQRKKSMLRAELSERGILPKKGENTFDRYKYFSEAQYKQLFEELFPKHGLELQASEEDYSMYQGTEKQSNGRQVKICFRLHDTETGFYEESWFTGEGLDKGDKAGYKAFTGALKYFLGVTFMVATGDDAEAESPSEPTPLVCSACRKPLQRTMTKDGTPMEVNDIIEYSRKKFKKVLCPDCMAKEVTK